MSSIIKRGISATKDALAHALGRDVVESLDFSYLTEPLIAAYEANTAVKVAEPDSETLRTTNWRFYGHDIYFSITYNRWSYTNSNPSSGDDSPQHLCGSGYQWNVARMTYEILPATSCNPQKNLPFRGY